jgi:hypothetical protein
VYGVRRDDEAGVSHAGKGLTLDPDTVRQEMESRVSRVVWWQIKIP